MPTAQASLRAVSPAGMARSAQARIRAHTAGVTRKRGKLYRLGQPATMSSRVPAGFSKCEPLGNKMRLAARIASLPET